MAEEKERNQRAIFDFLSARFRSQESFKTKELERATDLNGQSFRTYWSKWIAQFTVPVDDVSFRVSEAFRSYSTWDRFRDVATQVRRAASEYTSLIYNDVIMYEFFMPLTNEGLLRNALDALFFKDTVESRLKTLDKEKLNK
jgi:hypothetical protein